MGFLVSVTIACVFIGLCGCENDLFESGDITVILPSSYTEDGTGTPDENAGVIQLAAPPLTDVIVTLAVSSSGNGRVHVPGSVTIGATNQTATFGITILASAGSPSDPVVPLSDKVITITASSPGYDSGSGSFVLIKPQQWGDDSEDGGEEN